MEKSLEIPKNCPEEPSAGADACHSCAFAHGRDVLAVVEEYQNEGKCPIKVEGKKGENEIA